MFSGIIEELGIVKSLDKTGAISKLCVWAPKIGPGSQPGESVCVNGACLTIVETKKDSLIFEIMQETLKRTSLGLLKKKDNVNLERALKVEGRIDGHFVTGHIDATATISKQERKGGDIVMEIEPALEQILRYVVLKGSVALDGVSLTVSAQKANSFCVSLIPYTLKNTTLGLKKAGNLVNIECDILAKYTDRLLSSKRQTSASNVTSSFLKEHGFI